MKSHTSARKFFPDPREALGEGLVMVGGRVDFETLFEAYSFGIFPWPQEGMPMLWFCPERRGVLDFKDLHIAKSLQKFIRRTDFELKFNTEFAQVVAGCKAQYRAGQMGTWITKEIAKGYLDLHKRGFAHSIECWQGGELVGGLYGVFIGGVFAGESMFHRKPNASKFCLYHLIQKLKAAGHTWMDIQMVSDGMKAWGGKYISRDLFLSRLQSAQQKNAALGFT